MKRTTTERLIHVVFWISYGWISYLTHARIRYFTQLFFPGSEGLPSVEFITENGYIPIILVDLVLKIAMVYGSLALLSNFKMSHRKIFKLVLSLGALFSVTLLIILLFEAWFSTHFIENIYFKASNRLKVFGSVFHIGIFSLTLGYHFSKKAYTAELNREILQKENIDSELRFLKSQINPHFLFNTLNNIYSLARKYEDEVLNNSITRLSNLMRYMVNDSSSGSVSLEQELEYLNYYIELQKLRIPNDLSDCVSYEVSGDFSDYKIEPLLLIPFVENAFKYGIGNTSNPFRIDIRINFSDSILKMDVVNQKLPRKNHFLAKNTGTGIINATKRLSLLYPEKHVLVISDKKDVYKVELKIDLSQ